MSSRAQSSAFFLSLFTLSIVLQSVFSGSVVLAATAVSVQPNELGFIPVLEYHRFGEKDERWVRSYDGFRSDLEWLYNNNYRAVSVQDYFEQKINIPFGKKPVIFTFDDGHDSQIQLNAFGEVMPHTAVFIMDEFLKVHPDFGSSSVFYINRNFFSASPDRLAVLKYLEKTGREVQQHTATHTDLSKIPAPQVEGELSWLTDLFQKAGLTMHQISIAYPFGGVPIAENLKIVQKYAKIGFLVGADPARMPYDPKFDAHHIPRIQAIDDEWKRWFRRAPGVTAFQKDAEIFIPFVSDGKPGIHKAFPYHACNDPEAQTFIDFKSMGIFGKLKYALFAGYFMNFPLIFERYLRQEILFRFPHGIYFTSSTAAGETGKRLVQKLSDVSGNMVVFDIKETPGTVSDLEKLVGTVRSFREKGLYVVARIVVFKDQKTAAAHPSWAIQNAGGGVWHDEKGVAWLDPSHPEAQDYIIGLAKKVAAIGVDEIQYDYVRFPTEGSLSAMRFHSVGADKWPTIRDFLRRSRKALMPTGVALSADIFGIVGWNKGYDAKSTGQKIECVAPYLDAIYPMGYPSHFGPGFAGYDNPADKPYDFTHKTTKFFVDFAEGTYTHIRPWLQAFTYRVTIPYNSDYIYQQIKATKDAGGTGFALWNAGNNYDVAWGAF
ncbi:MAG: putative glycoside hydrolase [Patescibacteria group bacterium]